MNSTKKGLIFLKKNLCKKAFFLLALLIIVKAQTSNVTNSSSSSSTTEKTPITSTNKISSSTSAISLTTTPNTNIKCNCNLEGGRCESENVCKCNQDYYGDYCEYKLCKNDTPQFSQCNHGTCLMNFNNTSIFKCKCDLGYEGANCEKPICKDYCYNDAECSDGLGVFNTETDSFNTTEIKKSCTCTSERFSGERCEFDKCFNKINQCPSNCTLDSSCKCLCGQECDKFYCNNQKGTCYENKSGQLSCKCNIGYSGPTCLVNECSGYCFNGGTCIPTNSSKNCNCPEYYNGTRCEHFVKPVENKQTEKSALRTVIYGFSITLLICLLSLGAYYTIQKGYLSNLNFRSFFSRLGNESTSSVRNMSFIRNSFSFNKLEDEQSITQNELNNI